MWSDRVTWILADLRGLVIESPEFVLKCFYVMGQGCHSKMNDKKSYSKIEDLLSEYTVEAYAVRVEDFSSEYARENSSSYSVRNLAGESTIFPRYGDFTQACVLRTYGPWWHVAPSSLAPYTRPDPDSFLSHDFVDVSYDTPVYPDRVNVFETYHPGAVVRILAYCQKRDETTTSRWITLWSGRPELAPQESRIFSPPLVRVYEPAKMIRLEFNSSLCGYYPEIDAVQLVGLRVNPTTMCIMDQESSNLRSPCAPPAPDADCVSQGLSEAIRRMDLDDSDDEPDGYFTPVLGEIIEKIFSYLDLRSLCKAAGTCRLFRRYAYDTLQYRELNLQPFWTRVNDETLGHLEDRCQHLRKLNLSWCGNYGLIAPVRFQQFVSTSCGKLTSLSLGCCKFITEHQLEVISRTCTQLRDLDLQSCRSIGSYGFIHLAKMGLRRLNLYRTTIETGTLVGVVKTNPELEHLNIGSCINLAPDDVTIALSSSNPKLKSIDLWRAQALSDIGVNALAEGCPQLEEIDLGWCSDVRSESGCIVNLVSKCNNMKKLIFTANRTICDTDLEAISRCCPRLEQLDILGTGQVSQDVTQGLLDECRQLRMLDVSFCSRISFSTYQHWLKLYPHVDIKKSFVDQTT